MKSVWISVFFLATALLVAPGDVLPHSRSISYSTWHLEPEGARVDFRIRGLELTRLPATFPWVRYLPEALRLCAGDDPCLAGQASRVPNAPDGWAVFHWEIQCPDTGVPSIRSGLLDGIYVGHTHFARLSSAVCAREDGVLERVLVTGQDARWDLSDDTQGKVRGTSVWGYIRLGVEHISGGWDHLTFVFALLLLAASLREVVTLVTGFTLAHSLTLGLAVLGVFRPEASAVEILIGFSIALVAAENSWLLAGRGRLIPAVFVAFLVTCLVLSVAGSFALFPTAWVGLALFSACHFGLLARSRRPERLRAAVAFAFGLVHGFGFAGVLMEMDLPVNRLLPGLFGFNVGVEVGQLMVVALFWPLSHWLDRRRPAAYRLFAEIGSSVVCCLGIYWLVTRAWS
jgi:hypothetical protein